MNDTTFILFGATGDLAKRKIFPALYNLLLDNQLPEKFSVVGLGRRELSNDTFRENVKNSLREFSRNKPIENNEFERFIENFHYSPLNNDNLDDYKKLLSVVENLEKDYTSTNRMFYFSVAPEFFEVIASNIKASGLGNVSGWKKLVIEKPFGHDLKSAHHLNDQLSKAFSEEEIYRIDHYLGKNMVQKLRDLKSQNPLLSSLWKRESIANIQISAIESVGVEERAGYYDHTGALRDMFQNHMLQVLSLVAVKNDPSVSIRAEKKDVLENLKGSEKHHIATNFIRGQYAKGSINGKEMPGYKEEPGVAEDSTTETFLAARVLVDNDMWKGVPFYVRTGKKTAGKVTKIVVEFKKENNNDTANYLEIEVNPNETITLFLNNESNERIPLSFDLKEDNSQEAYEKLIRDALKGDPSFFAHWDEVRLSWEFVQPILDMMEEKTLPVYPYAAGTNGPKEADELLSKDGFKWL